MRAEGARVVILRLEPPGALRLELRSGEGRGDASKGEALPSGTIVLESHLLEPFSFGGFALDPFEELAGTLARMEGDLASLSGPARGKSGGDAAPLALWCRLELDLARFARDPSVRAACDAAAGTGELARFAAFNDFERALHRAIAPAGLVPGRWKRWLAGEPYRAPSRAGNSRRAAALFARLERVFRTFGDGARVGVAPGRISADTASRQSPE